MPDIEIYTDGACSGNPGNGGWGAILRYGKIEKELLHRIMEAVMSRTYNTDEALKLEIYHAIR